MYQRWNNLVPALAVLLAGGLAHATASTQAPPSPQPAQPASSVPSVIDDPLGRETPRGSFLGFVGAAQAGNLGEVEDVGLRTTSLRTLGRTLVHVPNGTLATMDLENFSRRDKFLLNPTIALHYQTRRTQLEQVLTGIRRFLAGDVRIEADTSRARLIRFGSSSLDIEVFAYVRVPNFEASLAVQEEMLLGVMDIVQKAGTALAVPSQTMSVRQETAETQTPPATFR